MDAMMLELVKRAVGALIRHGLTFVFGLLGLTGAFSDDEVTNWGIAVAGLIVAVGWSLYQKYRSEKAVDKALDLPQTATREDLKKVINNG